MTTPSIPQLTQALTTQGLPAPHPLFLTPILSPGTSQRTAPPMPALAATAKLRLLNADLTQPHILDPSKTLCLPPGIADVRVVSRVLTADVPVQVLDIQDLSRSRWEQVEALEMERKGETTKGRQVIRAVPTQPDGDIISGTAASPETTSNTQGNANQNAGAAKSNGPFKLLLQDMKGQTVYGFELKRVDKVGYPPTMNIGCKIMLKKGAKVARGLVLMEPGSVLVLGGKIEALDKSWREGREKALRDAVGAGRDRNND
ncbi:hypothetical protein M430DRAFT_146597 [Amorphotheca resinae ATCC 22711]|uniref:RecQ-mediated genome instability protein 1 n=1 Tax=Amorphotheca resinae ATCC 22711 TaxID=857342 RepID=A0A2T3ARS6_AMORE|nr:hypothetical protein M430DRAFT_146597 [Amorphotheca resinae ATCC 22711]PSS09054.1 hypothetical protein M430DRAFT_146597 [Amorphotheca resinae ATCC 22711]